MPKLLQTFRLTLCFLLLSVAFCQSAISSGDVSLAQEQTIPSNDPLSISLVSEEETISPGRPFWVAIQLKIDDTWHAYWKNPGDAGMAPALTWNLPEGFQAGPLLWPTPKRFELGPSVGYGYEGEASFLVQITPSSTFEAKTASLSVEMRWVVCSDSTCLPGESSGTITLPVSKNEPILSVQNAEIFKLARAGLPQKLEAMNAQRQENLVTLSFQVQNQVDKVEFFPEVQHAIDSSAEPILETQAGAPNQYTAILSESQAAPKLKGVLVVHSSQGKTAYEVDLPIAPGSEEEMTTALAETHAEEPAISQDKAIVTEASSEFEGGLLLAIFFAFIGGMILNLMPCVLPVISFKVLSFVKLAGQSRKMVFQHGLAFSFGVILSFWVLASFLLILQAYGRSVGWGFQLQEPLFVAILAALIFIFGLSLFGLFEIGTSLISAASQAQQAAGKRNELVSSFFSGILATAVATPCTGPFLGSAVGFAVTLPAIQALLIFTSIGLGMSFPYIALTAFPKLLRFMPKPGAWMVIFKEIMGFLMMATVLWLVWVFGAQTGSFAVSLLLAGFFLLAVAGWVYGKWDTLVQARVTRLTARAIVIVIVALGSNAIFLSSSSWAEAMGGTHITPTKSMEGKVADAWEEFSPQRLAELREQGIPVFIDFTAKWCLICQANHLVLSTDQVEKKFSELGVVRMKADWTKRDEVIAAELKKLGRNSVPLYVLYTHDDESKRHILPQVLTPEVVLATLEKL